MANNIKGTIQYAYFVEDVSRKFTLRKNTCSNKQLTHTDLEPTRYMGGGVKKTSRFDSTAPALFKQNYMFLRFNPRTSSITSDEQTIRTCFRLASKAAARWAKDLNTIVVMQQDWKQASNGSINGVHKQGYTLRGWLFAVAFSYASDGQDIPQAYPHASYTPAA